MLSPVTATQISITAPLISGARVMYSAALSFTTGVSAPLISGIAGKYSVVLTGFTVPYVPTPELAIIQSAAETLGCGTYEVYFKSRGGDLFICRALNITKLSWSRTLNGVSDASIDFALRGEQGNCCDCVSQINPWEHEMSIYRDGNEVWCGPVVGGEINDGEGTGRFDAKDLSTWFGKRWVEVRDTDIEFDQTDIVDVYKWLIEHAYYKDPWNMYWFFNTEQLGIPIDRTYISFDTAHERWGGSYPMVDAELSSLGQSGIDYTTIRRVMLIGDLKSSVTATARFTDAHWVSPPVIIITGTGMATEVGVGGGGGGASGWYEDQIWIERPDDVQREQFGLLQYFEAAPSLDQEDTNGLPNAITQRAFGLRELKKTPFEYVSGGSLSRHAPVTFDQLIPGRYFRVDLAQTCRTIQGNYMLNRVSVNYTDAEEDIKIDLTPPGVEKLRG